MAPELFIEHWTDHGLTEQQGHQRHFADLCALAHFAIPRDPAAFTYEKQVTKLAGQRGSWTRPGGRGWRGGWR